ncbi:uncharacterized protein BT62DRAFT_927171 [Guyanagaster necrorhizus]|uniref:HMG box domain-containing protein n=1 Tax=Guyanagaster necrorhizus TaxID=856835 RepID=A0A9P7W3G2_9AGAR|nr:uncharacterized protein BT62DRAFT_927171 [Guyanagaster necrorhizus MCA 3950]KAG7451467.1 hypothetical protein BT62DRAFT_927171 [Guyanagaster necrorhizus MCA 3950]
MPKTSKDSSVKAMSKASRTKTAKEGKAPREPSKYQQFMSVQLKLWKEQNPDRSARDAMKEVAVLWRDSPENPNRGKAPKPKKKKAANSGSSSEPFSSSQPRSSDKEGAPSRDL